jgi:hypothetical protein
MLGAALLGERNRKYEAVMNLAELLDLDIEGDTSKIEEEVTTQLASAAKFSEILENRGVPVPMKDSPSTEGKQIPALAKTDPGFIALQEHDDDIVAAAALARLAIKSTILETRINTFLEVADTANGMLPVPLNYCGATTTGRDSGWIYNPQNLPRVNPKQSKLSDALRNCMKAPEGYSVVVADLSGIELRVNHFLWKVDSTMELYQNDPQADLYRAAGAQVHGCTAEEVTKDQRQIEKIKALGLGFGAGASTFVSIAKTMGGMDITLDQAQDWVSQWRSQYRDIVEGWKTCGKVLQDIRDGIERDIDPWGLCKTNAQGILLPSGRLIRYPKLRTEEGGTWDDGRSKSSWVYGEGRHKTFLTGPKVDENCIAEGTRVLTDKGWVPIEEITESDLVHDGVELVQHGGLVCKSVQSCVSIDGVYMTPDHEVLTNDGWKIAEQVEEPFRPNLRGVDYPEYRGNERTPRTLEVPVRVREAGGEGRGRRYIGSEARRNPQLRVYDTQANQQGEPRAWDVETPSLRRVPKHDRPLQATIASSVEKLRSAWDYCMRPLEVGVRVILGRYGTFVPAGVGFGPRGQRRTLLTRELQVGSTTYQYDEQAQHRATGGRTGVKPQDRHREDDAVQQAEIRLAHGITDRTTRLQKQVYDILNCGPRHRFVVRGTEGPFIVHNCVQALARDVLKDYKVQIFAATRHRSVLDVHDELVYIVPTEQAKEHLDTVQSIMRTPPRWWPELVTWSEGDIANIYGAAK